MGRSIGQVAQVPTVTNMVPIGGIAQVLRSGDAYKAIGECVQRSIYTALSAAFPRNGSLYSTVTATLSAPASGGIAYGNGVIIALYGTGTATNTAMYSADGGNTFSTVTLPFTGVWAGVVFGGGLFVAIPISSGGAAYNACATSPDGIVWTARTLPSSQNWSCIGYGGGMFVIACGSTGGGASNVGASSPDGINWTARTMPTTSQWSAFAYGGGTFVAIATGGTTAAASSTNGTSWTARTMPVSASWVSIDYGAGKFVAVCTAASSYIGSVATSADGASWASKNISPMYKDAKRIAFGNSVFVIVTGSNGCQVSVDGDVWTPKALPSAYASIAYAGNFFFAGHASTTAAALIYAENSTDSDWLYLSGTAGQFVRVK